MPNPERTQSAPPIERAWSLSASEVLAALHVTRERGLDSHGVAERKQRFGPNRLRQAAQRSALRILLDQLVSLMVGLLGIAAILAFVMTDWVEGSAIVAVIVVNTAIGFVTEWKAVRSMEALHRLGQVRARVRRDAELREVPAADLVPGDIVVVEGGDVISADLRLIESSKLQANESALTGESVPVDKSVESVGPEAVLAERTSMLFKGTGVTRGAGEGVVVATGLASELGSISALVSQTEAGTTPLERRLNALGRRLITVTVGIALVLFAIGMASGRELGLMLQTAIALAVATVPEGLPVVATIALARGMWRMARHNALINRLSAVETLGATGVICTDKTGTLTENRMRVARLALADGDFALKADPGRFEQDGRTVDSAQAPGLREALEIGVLCNNADWRENESSLGDPMEAALLAAGAAAGIRRAVLVQEQPEEREEAFDTDTKMMATIHRRDGAYRVAVKGAPEAVLAACTRMCTAEGEQPLDDASRKRWLDRNEALAAEGLRLLALASKQAAEPSVPPYQDLVFLGLVGLVDPPRADVQAAITRCRSAGIEVVMVTGDQPATASYVARAVGLVGDTEGAVLQGSDLQAPERCTAQERERLRNTRVFARVSPQQKLHLIAIHQHAGDVVAMTGDGVNDAPALKKADIGVAMGQRGTQVAREAADMVLTDDAFGTIVLAVRQGRIIFDNIRKFVVYLLSCNVSEVLVLAVATVGGTQLPILPLQILFLNLVTDVFPALALGVGPGDPGIMHRRPRPAGEAILTRSHWGAIAGYGALITIATLGAFFVALHVLSLDAGSAVTISFLTLALAQLFHIFNMRERESRLFANDIVRNIWVWASLLLCLLLLGAALYVPWLAKALQLVPPDTTGWLAIGAFALAPVVLGQLCKALARIAARARTRLGQ